MNFLANVTALAQDAGQGEYATDPDFLTQLPVFIVNAENRILRDLDLLTTRITDDSGELDPNHRHFTFPTDIGTFIVLDQIRLVVNNRVQPALDWISKEAMNVIYPDFNAVGNPSIPRYVAPFDGKSVLIGPAPDQPYQVFCDGTQYPNSLTTGATITLNTTPPTVQITTGSPADIGTYISNNIPDLFHAAQMISVSAWMRQFSGMADDPKMARNWTEEYSLLKESEAVVEARKRLSSVGWSTKQPQKVATPPQT